MRGVKQLTMHRNGFIALVSVLLVGAIGFSIAMTVILLGVGVSRTSFTEGQSAQARALTNACAEEALMQIRNAPSYTGTGSLVFGEGSCEYRVVNTGGQNRFINVTGTVATVIPAVLRKVSITLDAVSPNIHLVAWEEVAD